MAQEDPTMESFEIIPKETFYPMPQELNIIPHTALLDVTHSKSERRVADVQFTVKSILSTKQKADNYLRWGDLKRCKNTLRLLFKDSNRDIKEHIASKLRFQERIRERQTDAFMLQDQMYDGRIEIEQSRKVVAQMEQHVKNYSVYEAFLESVAQASPEFNSGGDIINRYETLESARLECERVLEMELESFTEIRKEMMSLLESESSRLKELRNRVVGLQVQQKQAKERRMYWEHTVERMKVMIHQRKEEELIMSGGCWDLYLQICKNRYIRPTLSRGNLKGQLDFIVKAINYLKEVNTLAASNVQTQKK